MKRSVIGLFGRVINISVELCSDWPFHSAAHFSSSHSRKETQRGKYIIQYFLSQLYRWVIILYIKRGHQGATINMRDTENAQNRFFLSPSLSRFTITWTPFILWSGSTYHTFYKIRCLSVVLKIMHCNVTGYHQQGAIHVPLVGRIILLERVSCSPCFSEYRHLYRHFSNLLR